MATQVAFSELNTWLGNQPDNTADTPYELNITGITTDNIGESRTTGTLGNIIQSNYTKYVDLSETVLPNFVTSLANAFWACVNLVKAPAIPNGVTTINGTFSGCTSLIEAPVIPNSVTSMTTCFATCRALVTAPIIPDNVIYLDYCFNTCNNLVSAPIIPNSVTRMSHTFEYCTSLSNKPIIPSTVTNADSCYYGVTTKNWKGTESQITSYKSTLETLTQTDSFEVQVYDTDKVTLLDSVYWVNFSNLNTWLDNQPTNTADTPYRLNIIGLTSSNTSDLGDELSTFPIKYVDLRVTVLPQDLTTLSSVFNSLSGLVYAPIVPANVTTMIGAFRDCSALKEMPMFESGGSISDLTTAFYNCTSLQSVSSLPSGILNMNATFRGCTSLRQVPLFPDTVTDVSVCYYGCTLLTVKPIIPSTVTTSTSCYDNVTTPNWKGTQSQAESFLSTFFAQTTDSELQIYNNDRVTYDHSIYNIDISNISTASDFVYGLDPNTPETAYKIYLRGLTSSNAENITRVFGYVYRQTPTKFYDFGYTTIPQGTSLTDLFWRSDGYYMYSCSSMVTAPVLPTDQTSMTRTFSDCYALKNVTIPNGITNLSGTFMYCVSLEESPAIPSSVTSMEFTFSRSGLKEAPVLPSGLTNMEGTFEGCTSLIDTPLIPNSVTALSDSFNGCTNITEIQSIPSGITGAVSAFEGCTSLRKIDEFSIPLNTLKNNTAFRDMFKDCPSLETIGFKVDASTDWHVFSLTIGQSTVEGTVYGVNTNKQITTATIPSTSITKSSIRLPVLTDELWFPSGLQASEIEDAIEDMLTYKYGVFNKTVIPPDDKQMIIWADEDSQGHAKVVTNLELGGGGGGGGFEKEVVITSDSKTITKDTMLFANGSGITITLAHGSTENSLVEVFAVQACTLTYYTAQSTTASLSMVANSRAVFIYFGGWKYCGVYGAVWN